MHHSCYNIIMDTGRLRKWKHERVSSSIENMVDTMGNFMVKNNRIPTYQEICDSLGISKTTLFSWLKEAQAHKLIKFPERRYDNFEIPGIYYVDNRRKNND